MTIGKTLLAVAMVTCLTAAAAAPTVAGTWTMTVQGSPHGDVTMGLTLTQDGSHVTGTFHSPHGDMAVAGEFAEGQLKLATTQTKEDEKILFDARLDDKGALAGYLSSPMGDMKWTAARAATGGK